MNKIKLICSIILSIIIITSNAQNIKTGRTSNSIVVKVNTDNILVVRNTLSGINAKNILTDKGSFTRLDVDGYTPSTTVGDPLLPVNRSLIEVPLKASYKINVKSYNVMTYSLTDLGYTGKLIPVQAPVAKNDETKKPLVINDKAYSKNAYLTHPLVTVDDIGVMRGVRMARLNISPIEYNPSTNTIKVYSEIETEIVFVNADIAATKADKQKYYSPSFSSIQSKLLNYKAPTLKDAIINYPVKYVIVSDPMFQATLQPFVDWQTKRGFKVIEAYTNNAAVGTSTASIKSYLQTLYTGATANDPAPSFVLFVGDVAQVPTFAGTTGTHPTDLYYCEYTGDFLPEVFYGRFSASTTVDLENQIEKTLQYERCEMPDKSFLNNVVLTAGFADPQGTTYGNGQINYETSNYYSAATNYTTYVNLYPACADSAMQIIQHVSDGIGFVNYTAHGSPSGWGNPSFQVSDVATLKNANKYPLMIGNCCLSNKFDETVCFGEALLRAYHSGAIGYIGASNSSYWDEDYFWACGSKAITINPTYDPLYLGAIDRIMHTHGEQFPQWYVSQGQMVQAGNLAVTMSGSSMIDYYWEIYHLMGDPSLMPYFKVPLTMTANYLPLIPLGNNVFNITTEPYAYVGISRGSVLYGAALADSLGNVTVNLQPITTPGYVNLVITKQNRQPIIDSVLVASPNGPYVILNNSNITDLNGNNNGVADFGELIKMNVILKNVGNTKDTTVFATLSTNDAYITLIDSVETWGVINSQSTKEIDSAFSFTVNNLAPDQHHALFLLKVSDQSGNTWNYNINVTLNAPALTVSYLNFDDSSVGNNNRRLDPGETANVTFKISNTGHCDAAQTNAILSTTDGFINITNPSTSLNTINKGASTNVTYAISAAANAILGSLYNLTLTTNSSPYSFQNAFNNVIGAMEEEFETHDFTKFKWDTTDTRPWIITTDTFCAPGLYSARSGGIVDNQSSSLRIYMNVLMDDSISFYRKVSCEYDNTGNVDWDNLQFFIDGNLLIKWDGEQNWARVAYPVSAGQHLFTWMYKKDGSALGGSDCAWIDNIMFPPFDVTLGVPDNSTINITDFNIYPNPARDNVNLIYKLSKEAATSFKIFTTTGACVYSYDKGKQQAGMYSKEINVAMLDKGIYYCTMLFNDKVVTRKFVITK